MTGPSSAPRGERAGTRGAQWLVISTTDERVVEDDSPDPARLPNREARRAAARALRKGRRR
ncbi:hypothetical protein [Streptomyces niveus]|uniref:hypothetical protein n=1 Tax=Streptomyces niveus TaxID=193462 RepID=UPI0003C6053B|nr:hypothetical protein [Streptomyces niveus]EST22802.1 hypothetical protein M877_28915 [Streptomyces niveus NCIMB 11891]